MHVKLRTALLERISGQSLGTEADRASVVDLAERVQSAGAQRAGVV